MTDHLTAAEFADHYITRGRPMAADCPKCGRTLPPGFTGPDRTADQPPKTIYRCHPCGQAGELREHAPPIHWRNQPPPPAAA